MTKRGTQAPNMYADGYLLTDISVYSEKTQLTCPIYLL